MVLLQTLLVIILVYYLLRIIGKWLFPKLMVMAANKMKAKFEDRFGTPPPFGTEKQTEDGSIIIERPNKQRKPSKNVGEYIDFEEIG